MIGLRRVRASIGHGHRWFVAALGDPWVFWGGIAFVLAVGVGRMAPYGIGYVASVVIAVGVGRRLRSHPVRVPTAPDPQASGGRSVG